MRIPVPVSAPSEVRSRVTRPRSISELLREDRLVPYFQPILSARQRAIIGVEALLRADLDNGEIAGAPWLFQQALVEDRLADLERTAVEKSIERFASLPDRRPDHVLFVNLGSTLTGHHGETTRWLVDLVGQHGLTARQVAIEILENRIGDLKDLRALIDAFREVGFLLALDDVGTGHSNLDRVPLLKPDVLKIDRGLVQGIEQDFHKQETFQSLVGLSRRIGSLVVAEGVETERQAVAALALGADLLQGFLLGRAEEDMSVLQRQHRPMSAAMGIDSLAQRFKSYMVEEINQRKLRHRRYNILINEVLCLLAGSPVEEFEEILKIAVSTYPSVECFYVLDGAGTQVTETVWNPALARRASSPIFRPAPKGTDHSLKEYYYVLLDVELQKYTTEPYVSFASGNLSRTISTYFRDVSNHTLYILCIDVLASDPAGR
jgi:EAL domain-containing protein (putative c-di-GMP-specific phosphodiesterase class I)